MSSHQANPELKGTHRASSNSTALLGDVRGGTELNEALNYSFWEVFQFKYEQEEPTEAPLCL